LKNINAQSFKAFVIQSFETLNPGTEFLDSWYIDYLSEILCEAVRGNLKRIIINLPPRFLKSHIITTAFPAWLLGISATNRIIAASYSQALSNKLSVDTKLIMESDWYKAMFPDTQIYKKQNEKKKFMTTKNGFRFATSSGGTIIGEGGDFLIIDDPHHPAQVRSKYQRDKLFDWFDKSFLTRLNNQEKGVVIVVMQRLHANDLSGYLLAKPKSKWNVFALPIIEEDDKTYKVGKYQYSRQKGELLNEKLMNLEAINDMQCELGDIVFTTQFMQKPVSSSGNIIKPDKLVYYDHLPIKFDVIIQSWDPAAVVSSKADYSACVTLGVFNQMIYVIDIFRERLSYSQLKAMVVEKYKDYKPLIVLIENKMSGHALISELLQEYLMPVSGVDPKIDKVTRFLSISGMFDSKKVVLPKSHPLIVDFINELTSFPESEHDDMVDSLSQGISYLKSLVSIMKRSE